MELLGIADLVDRWVYSRQGVHKLVRSADFPNPALAINRGRTKAWRLSDIEAYEQGRPELRDEVMKVRKQVGYYIANCRKEAGLTATAPMSEDDAEEGQVVRRRGLA